jgi:hypothetical protein
VGYRVDMVRFDERGEVEAYRPFVTGFAQNEGTDDGSFWGGRASSAAARPCLAPLGAAWRLACPPMLAP